MAVRKRKVGPEPRPSPSKLGREKQLRDDTRDFCVRWHRWYWGEDQFNVLDYADERAQWPETIKLENRARPLWHDIKSRIEAVVAFTDEYEADSGGLYSQGLAAMAPHLQKAIAAYSGAHASRMIVEPSRTTWLRDRVLTQFSDGRRPEQIPVFELAVYSILGGWWPKNVGVRATRLDITKGVSVATVLSEEQKNIRAALKQLEKLRRDEADLVKLLFGR